MYTKNFNKLTKKDASTAGGKGASLGEMTNVGIPVPPGFVVVVSAFEAFLKKAGLEEKIENIVQEVNPEEIESGEKASRKIRELIKDEEVPEDIQKEIREAYKTLGAESVAVRSSATAEDSSEASWAGELESYLHVRREDLIETIKTCWSSLFTPRAIFYRFEKGLEKTQVSVAVVVQKMVNSEVSGVCFTAHPVTKEKNKMVIEAGYGLGESIVGGMITPDKYEVFKHKGEFLILEKEIQPQEIKIERGKQGAEKKEVSPREQEKQKLEDEKIMELANISVRVEEHYGKPQDIEWALEEGRIYIVQSRPITTL